jgi:CheY-like chemotaxis protein
VARVLAVDDRRDNLLALQAILEGLPIEIVSVTSGEDALKRLLVEDYAVILLDAHMPGMDGFETAGHVKQRERTRHIPILFLTAVDYDPHLAFRGYQAGAVDYITKPFDPWVLRSKVTVFVDLWTMHSQLAERAPWTTRWSCSTGANPTRPSGLGTGLRPCGRPGPGSGRAGARRTTRHCVRRRLHMARARPLEGVAGPCGSGHCLRRDQLLKASLTFSPACLRLPFAWSP